MVLMEDLLAPGQVAHGHHNSSSSLAYLGTPVHMQIPTHRHILTHITESKGKQENISKACFPGHPLVNDGLLYAEYI